MGRFLNAVRRNTIAQPLARDFDRAAWENATVDDALDEALLASGIAVADMLAAMRPRALLKSADRTLLAALVACANHQTASTHRDIFESIRAAGGNAISMDMLLGRKEPDTGGTLGEVTDGLGDSFVFPLREAMDMLPRHQNFARKRWLESLERAYAQGLLANRWYLARFFWMDVLWFDARIDKAVAVHETRSAAVLSAP